MKQRTSLAIDEGVRRAAEAEARRRGVSLSRYVTEILRSHLATRPETRFPRTVTFRSGGRKRLSIEHERLAFRD